MDFEKWDSVCRALGPGPGIPQSQTLGPGPSSWAPHWKHAKSKMDLRFRKSAQGFWGVMKETNFPLHTKMHTEPTNHLLGIITHPLLGRSRTLNANRHWLYRATRDPCIPPFSRPPI